MVDKEEGEGYMTMMATTSDFSPILVGQQQVVLSTDLLAHRLLGAEGTWMITHRKTHTPYAILRCDVKRGLTIESRWQLGMLWSGNQIRLYHDPYQPSSLFEEDVMRPVFPKAVSHYRLGGNNGN